MTQTKHNEYLPIEKVFRDPVHNYIHVQHAVILDLINTREFQRLRRIKQLGTTSFTFHGGEHTRFSHSLGVYEITRRICDIFERNYSVAVDPVHGWDDNERLVALCAALLHDIGHGPYSHTFETIFQTNHEEITIAIITSPETEVFQVLNQVSEGFPEKVASVIRKDYPNPQVVQLISSQIDADRMDYLLRDAYFTGTEYGTFDLTRILRVIRPHRDGITFTTNGMHAVEDYVVSRYQMYMQIYFHPVSRGMEVILDHLLNQGAKCYQKNPKPFEEHSRLIVPFFKNEYTLEDYLNLDDNVLNSCFVLWRQSSDSLLSDLSNRFLNRHPLKSVTFSLEKDTDLLEEMTALIEKVGYNATAYTAINTSFDLPYDFYRPDQKYPRTQIEMMEKDGTLIELSQLSALVAALAGQTYGDERFYFPKEMLADPKESLFATDFETFQSYIHNGRVRDPKLKERQ